VLKLNFLAELFKFFCFSEGEREEAGEKWMVEEGGG
jgi:hypothetical protein